MNDLEFYFQNNDKRLIQKWSHYFEIYDRYFSKYRNTDLVILEIGVSHGGSLQMWGDYFGPKCQIYGIDSNPKCKELEEDNIKIFIGSQSDPIFLDHVKTQIPPIDILIDDGGHSMNQQIISFEKLFDHIKSDGIYLCEDLHTSYWLYFGGGHKRRGTFIEYSKNLVDNINAFHSNQRSLKANNLTKSMYGLHYYDSLIIIEKRVREKPREVKTGAHSFGLTKTHKRRYSEKGKQLVIAILTLINKTLRFLRLPGFIWK